MAVVWDTNVVTDQYRDTAKNAALYRVMTTPGTSDAIIAVIEDARYAGATTDEITRVLVEAWMSDV